MSTITAGTRTQDEVVEALRTTLSGIEESVVTQVSIADLIRKGASETTMAKGWGDADSACALSAAGLAAKALGYIE